MRTTLVVIASLLMAACSSGSDDPDSASTDVDGSTPSSTTEVTSDADPSTTTRPSVDSATETTTNARGTATTVDAAASSTSVADSSSTTVAGAPAATTTPGATATTVAGGPTPTSVPGGTPTPTPTIRPSAPAATTTTVAPAPPGPDAAAARAAFDRLVRDSSPEGIFVDLPTCPLDPGGELTTAVYADIADASVVAAIDSPAESGVFDIGGDFGPMLTCDRFSADDADSIGLFAFASPDDLEAYAEFFANPDDDESVVISVEPTTTLGTGTFHHVCGLDPLDQEFNFCEVDWVTDEIVIGAYVSGALAEDVDRDALERGLTAQLQMIVDAFTS